MSNQKAEFFKTQMTRLKNVFGEKNYPEERVRLLWKRLQFADSTALKDHIDKLFALVDRASRNELLATLYSMKGAVMHQ